MKEHLNENTLYATVAMLVSDGKPLILVVEGPDDHLMLKDHCSDDLFLLEGTGGREQILRTAALARQRHLERVRFLVDRDYDDYGESGWLGQSNVFVSRGHDCFLDIVIADPRLLHKVVEVHSASATRRPSASGSRAMPAPESVVVDAIELALNLAAVRIVAARRGLNLTFASFAFGPLKASEFNARSIANTVLVRSAYCDDHEVILDESAEVHEEISSLPVPPIGDHDLFAALARILSTYDVKISDKTLQRTFIAIAAMTCDAVMKTSWYEEIKDWSSSHGYMGLDCLNVALAA